MKCKNGISFTKFKDKVKKYRQWSTISLGDIGFMNERRQHMACLQIVIVMRAKHIAGNYRCEPAISQYLLERMSKSITSCPFPGHILCSIHQSFALHRNNQSQNRVGDQGGPNKFRNSLSSEADAFSLYKLRNVWKD